MKRGKGRPRKTESLNSVLENGDIVEYCKIARDLGYPDSVRARLAECKTQFECERIMKSARDNLSVYTPCYKEARGRSKKND